MRARCTLITGFLGAGKTTLIRHLLATRPAGERWAVIVNDFGVVGIDGTTLGAAASPATAGPATAGPTTTGPTTGGAAEVVVREVAGGCICCAANVPLRVAITDVLRRVRPQRLLIEPSGLGHPAAILATLAEPGLAGALEVGPVLCVVDPRDQPGAAAGVSDVHAGTWHDQLASADVVVANKDDLLSDAERTRFRDHLAALFPPKQAAAWVRDGQIDPALLDAPRAPWRFVLTQPASHRAGSASAVEPGCSVPGLGTRFVASGLGVHSAGWLIEEGPSPVVFSAERLDRLLVTLPRMFAAPARLLRAKAAMRTERGTQLIDWAGGALRSEAMTLRGPSRLELLVEAPAPPDWSDVERALVGAAA
jgi:G3E family GTPase